MISLAITVCNESEELEALLDYLEDRALAPDYEIVVQIDKINKNVIKVFNSIREAGEETNIKKDGIGKCARKVRNHAGGYIWEFLK
jgi:hypothetical protein